MAPRSPRAAHLGVTPEVYDRMLAEQGGHCALCPAKPGTRRLHVDHDHRTMFVRGLLCFSCNRALPAAKDAAWLLRAAQYVRRGEQAPDAGRAADMRRLREEGQSMQAIADVYGISRQRVHQLLTGG